MSGHDSWDHLQALLRQLATLVMEFVRRFRRADTRLAGANIVHLDKGESIASKDVKPGVVFVSPVDRQPDHVSAAFVEHLRELGASERVLATARSLVAEPPQEDRPGPPQEDRPG